MPGTRRITAALGLGLFLLFCFFPTFGYASPAAKDEDTQLIGASAPSGPLNEQTLRIPMTVRGLFKDRRLLLEATLYKPDGDGPFPLLVLSHGSPREAAKRRSDGRQRFEKQSAEFVRWGFAVVIPMRRGFAASEGDWAEDYGKCEDAFFYESGLESAKDLMAAVTFMGKQPFVDRSRVLLVGQSAGGFASLALASQGFEGLVGVINFAGGRASRGPNDNCSPGRLVDALGKYGKTTKVPTLWIYAQNDLFFPAPLVRDMHRAFEKSGGKAQLVMVPPFRKDGHSLFHRVEGLPLWIGPVENFLKCLELLLSR